MCLIGSGLLFLAPDSVAQVIVRRARVASKVRVQPVAFPSTLFVDAAATGGSTGTSWVHAFTDLHDALAVARSGDQVWVAAGTYYAADPGGSQAETYTVRNGVKVYGGFTGVETMLAQRNPELNVTVLSADINRDDSFFPQFNIVTANSWNIVTMNGVDSTTRLDGFDLRTGHLFNAQGDRKFGAGVHLINSSPVVANCVFSNCVAANGGALHSDTGNPIIEFCTFLSNWSSEYSSQGAAIYNGSGTMVVRDTLFTGNRSESRGGVARGGAISTDSGSTFVERCRFISNKALPRGGNGSVAYGGALYVTTGLLRVTDSYFQGNDSNIGGAVASSYYVGSTIELYNNQFVGNHALVTLLSGGVEGGGTAAGVFGGPSSILDIVGCLVTGGTADNYGGALVLGSGLVSSSIFWGNSDSRGTIGKSQVKANRVYYSCVMNMLVGEPGEDPPEPSKFPNSIAADPLFVTTASGPYHLAPASPCIDAANNSAWPMFIDTDFDGNARFVDDPTIADTGLGPAPIADMGPIEVQ